MADDLGTLFELAARDMRDEFRDAMIDLLERESLAPQDALPPDVTLAGVIDVGDVASYTRTRHNTRTNTMWLLAAAAVAGLVALGAGLTRDRDGGNRASVAPAAPATGQCASGDPIGVVHTATVDLRVVLPASGDFCIVDNASALPVELLRADGGDPPGSANGPTLSAQALVPGAALVYTIDVPEGVPVASVETIVGPLESFASPQQRQLLVVDTRVGELRPEDAAAYDLNVLSASGLVLATLVPDPELIASAATVAGTAGAGGP